MLSLQHLTVTLGSRVVLRDISLDVQPKDIVCVLGEEGSGKTTLLKLLTREREADEGIVKIDGAILSQLPREVLRMYRERIGYLDEEAALEPSLTLEQNVALPLDVRGAPASERDRAVADLLKRLHLTGAAAKSPTEVSRGERQLAAFARAIASGPLIVLLDEPFQGIADETATLMAGMLENMRKKGVTIIVASAEERTPSFFSSPRIARLQKTKLTEEERAPTRSPSARAREIASVAMEELVERSKAADTSVAVEPVAETETSGKKKVRITAVGSL